MIAGRGKNTVRGGTAPTSLAWAAGTTVSGSDKRNRSFTSAGRIQTARLCNDTRVVLRESRSRGRGASRPSVERQPAFGTFTMIYARIPGSRSIWPGPTSDCGDNDAGPGRSRDAFSSRGRYGDGGSGQTIDAGRIPDRPDRHGDPGAHARLCQPRLSLALADGHLGIGRRLAAADGKSSMPTPLHDSDAGGVAGEICQTVGGRNPRRASASTTIAGSASHSSPPASAIGRSDRLPLAPFPRPGPAMARRPDPIPLPVPLLRAPSRPS